MKSDGGPAFPLNGPEDRQFAVNHGLGMSLRDWFAGQALEHLSQPILAAMAGGTRPPTRGEVAHLCYEIADAMLAERSKP